MVQVYRGSYLCWAECRRASQAADGPEFSLPPGVATGVAVSVVASVDWDVLPRSPQPPSVGPPGRRSGGPLSDTGSLAHRSSSAAKASHSLLKSPADPPAPTQPGPPQSPSEVLWQGGLKNDSNYSTPMLEAPFCTYLADASTSQEQHSLSHPLVMLLHLIGCSPNALLHNLQLSTSLTRHHCHRQVNTGARLPRIQPGPIISATTCMPKQVTQSIMQQ